MTTRKASHAGSWYNANGKKLSKELDKWIDNVPYYIDGAEWPIAGARCIIAPHAGYAYSGSCAAHAYACLSLPPHTKRIFLLGPAHAYSTHRCALTQHKYLDTPMGKLTVDTRVVADMHKKAKFDIMSTQVDEEEHSLEMHFPYIYKIIQRHFGPQEAAGDGSQAKPWPKIVPIMVGNTTEDKEFKYAAILAAYMSDSANAFIVSSDFCHWGRRFDYMYYTRSMHGEGQILRRRDKDPEDPRIFESIALIDTATMWAIENGTHAAFWDEVNSTKNTVCGRHPIAIILAAMEIWRVDEGLEEIDAHYADVLPDGEGDESPQWGNRDEMLQKKGYFSFVQYERSNEVEMSSDSSVSYASAYAIL